MTVTAHIQLINWLSEAIRPGGNPEDAQRVPRLRSFVPPVSIVTTGHFVLGIIIRKEVHIFLISDKLSEFFNSSILGDGLRLRVGSVSVDPDLASRGGACPHPPSPQASAEATILLLAG